MIKQGVKETIASIADKIVDNDYKEQKRLQREILLCVSCKTNNKKSKCSNCANKKCSLWLKKSK